MSSALVSENRVPSSIAEHFLLFLPSSPGQKLSYHDSCLRWAANHGLLPNQNAFKKAAQIRVDELAVLAYPSSNPVVTQICTDLLLWFFLADDQFDERKHGASPKAMAAISQNFIDILRTGDARLATLPLDRALLDLRERLLLHLPQEWLTRFCNNMVRYLCGCIVEAENRQKGITPSIQAYRDIRRASVGTYPCFDAIELAMEQTLPEAMADDAGLETLRHVASDVIAWINDIVSYRKESAFNDPHNIISVLMAAHRYNEAVAISTTKQLILAGMTEFRRRATQVSERLHDPIVARYIDGLYAWISGVDAWSPRSERYGAQYLALSHAATHDLLSTK